MPNIAIYEGGKAARMNGVSLITTDDGNDGKVTWVPQSERKTGTLYVSENGTYRAEDEGLHSWSKVTVRLAGAPLGLEVPTLPDPITGAEIPTGEIGLEEPVPPAGLEPIEDEPISADEAESILEDTEFDPSDLDPDSPNYDDAMEAIADALGVGPEDVKIVDPDDAGTVKESQPKVEDKGQEAVGTDPETGQPATITPSGKEGAIVPDELRIVSSPRKNSYKDGETIDYSGIQCALYKDGKLIRNARFDELTFPVTTATYDGNKIEYTDGEDVNIVLLTATVVNNYWQRDKYSDIRVTTGYMTPYVGARDGDPIGFSASGPLSVYATFYNGDLYMKLVSGESLTIGISTIRPAPEGDKYPKNYGRIFLGGSTYRPISTRYTVATWKEYATSIPESFIDPNLAGSKPIHAVGQKQSLPVQWSGGGTSLGSAFDVMVYMDNV